MSEIVSKDNHGITVHNIVQKDNLRKVQYKTLRYISDTLLNSFGPNGSDTVIKKGVSIRYTKDGRSIAEAINFGDPVEEACKQNILDIAIKNDKEVGDGTTSAVVTAFNVFEEFYTGKYKEKILSNINIERDPYEFRREFIHVCDDIKEEILKHKKEFTPEAAYHITLVSTNGDEKYANIIKDIYEKYGNDASINLETSTDDNDHIKTYDGMTLQAGYSDHVYVNTNKNTCELNNPRIYAFQDNIDVPSMYKLFSIIVENNIVKPCNEGKFNEMIPTVIITPQIGADAETTLTQLASSINSLKMSNIMVPLLIITNFYDAVGTYSDIITMCGARPIKKYIDNKVYEIDRAKGLAPSEDTIIDFYGTADVVIADSSSTRFINPYKMFNEGSRDKYSKEYDSLVDWLKGQIDNAVELGKTLSDIGSYKRRLASLQSNLVELYIGGSSVADKNQKMDLLMDAVKNCSSAAKYGYGYGANFEAARAVTDLWDKTDTMTPMYDMILSVIHTGVIKTMTNLYGSQINIPEMLKRGFPVDIRERQFIEDPKIYTSIMTDYTVIDSLGKLMVLMYGANQFITDTLANTYYMDYQY